MTTGERQGPQGENTAHEDGEERVVTAELRIGLPRLDAFRRADPPGARGTSELWGFAPQLIDFGCALFAAHSNLRPDHATRDLVMAAILRRALIITESIFNVLYHGQPESAVAMTRTLLDLELNAKLIHADPTDRMAKRLAAYHYMAGKRHGQKMATDRPTRDMLKRYEGAFDETLDTVRRYEGWFQAPGFDEVRADVVPGRPWHGHERVEDAFRAVGGSTAYYQSYDIGTFFVHATNVDFDFADIVNGRVMLKHPLTTDERMLVTVLGTSLGHLHTIMGLFATDKPIRQDQGLLIVDGEHKEPIDAVDAVGFMLGQMLAAYADTIETPSDPADASGGG